MAKLHKAILARRVTSDGVSLIYDHIPLGTSYVVDSERVRDLLWRETNGAEAIRRSIFVLSGESGGAGWMPLELLDVDEVPCEVQA